MLLCLAVSASMHRGREIRRVVLVYPQTRGGRGQRFVMMQPLGISYLAAVLRDRTEVRLLDASILGVDRVRLDPPDFEVRGLEPDELQRRIEELAPDVLGVSCVFSPQIPLVRETVRRAKRADPDLVTVTGGTHPSFLAEQVLAETPELDFVVLGEAEESFPQLLRALERGSGFEEIDGLAWRDGERIRVQPKTRFITDLDSLPFPARDLLDMRLYERACITHGVFQDQKMAASICSSRGCPRGCLYCSSCVYWGHKFRPRSPTNVLDEIEELVSRYGVEEIQFEDDNLTLRPDRAKAIFRGMIERGFTLKFSLPNGVALNTIDEEMVRLMREAGCYEVYLPFESGNERVLKDVMRKKWANVERSLEAAELFRRYGIRTMAYFMMGLPGETLEEMEDTYRLAVRSGVFMPIIFVAQPLPGSAMTALLQDRGDLPRDYRFENNRYVKSVFHTPEWTSEQVEHMAHSSFLRAQLRSFLRQPDELWRSYLRQPFYWFGSFLRYLRNVRELEPLIDRLDPLVRRLERARLG
jgi:magnesium-protoporphyrin IX monomethyl ester (oxidative) cyclase